MSVRCETCYRGRAHPPSRSQIRLPSQGADAAVAKFTEMRKESLESGQYDFRARSVLNAARGQAQQGLRRLQGGQGGRP